MAGLKEKLATMVSGEGGDEEWYEEGDDWEAAEGTVAEWGGEEEWEGEDGEDDWDEGEEEEDWDGEEEEEEDFGEEGVLQRCAMNGPNRQRNVGIHTIEMYVPQFWVDQLEMEEYDSQPERYGPAVIGKYTKGIGMTEFRFPTDDEDPASFALTVTHRLIDRMEKVGFNLTALFSPDGETVPLWNAFGRIDIGSESLIDRSKSMKTTVMDLFERYGDGEANIEGVDMYNACYGGQAAGLCVVNWVESDRWDGRYGLAIATDISESHHATFFGAGAACTGTLYFPEAPLPHHSHRASAIMHRLDFFKPIGWKSMAPLVDGKYSIDAYMTAVELCYAVMKKKMNDRRLFSMTDYNVFHTGGGFHVVKKAFERMCRADTPEGSYDDRQRLVRQRLLPSCHILKIVGPCHTVSSFLNTGSVIMSEWERALGKVLLVYTYGSGCASSLYQLRFDDLAWMLPYETWKAESFYRNSIKMHPSTHIHEVYIQTWMKFDYKPCGRELFQVDPWKYELDAYYLMEIDKWGRRFYHRGGVIAPALGPEYKLFVDKAEGRPKRHAWKLYTSKPVEKEQILEDEWKKLEYEMVFDSRADANEEVVQEAYAKGNPEHKITTVEVGFGKPGLDALEQDGQDHSYQIMGSWTGFKEMEDMEEDDGVFQFTVTVGENGWEDFYLVQDRDEGRRIHPESLRSWKGTICIGPHAAGNSPKRWRIDARDLDEVPEEDVGAPGDQYLVMFTWRKGCLKSLEWDKLEGERGEFHAGKYSLAGSWTCWDFVELEALGGGNFRIQTELSWLGLDFVLAREQDVRQLICPEGDESSKALSPDAHAASAQEARRWSITGNLGDRFSIDFFRSPEDPEDVRVSWEKVGSGQAVEPTPRIFLVGAINRWGKDGCVEMHRVLQSNSFACQLQLRENREPFHLLMFKRTDLCIYPDKQDCSQIQAHKVLGPGSASQSQCWAIGKAATDKAKIGDIFIITYDMSEKKVTWRKQ